MKFGISSLMLVVFAASVVFGIVLNGSFVAFAIGFVALAILLARLISQVGQRSLTVRETDSEADAHLLRNYLTDHGVTAWVEGGLAIQSYAGLFRPRVVVPVGQAELATQILLDLNERRNAPETADVDEPVQGVLADQSADDPNPAIGPFANDRSIAEEIAWPVDVPAVLRRFAQSPCPLFLDSARQGTALGRYSFLTADPFQQIRSRRGRVVLSDSAGDARVLPNTDPLGLIAAQLAQWPADASPDLPPFQGGAAGLFCYELCHQLEHIPRAGTDEFEMPDLAIGFYDWVLALDHERCRAWIIATGIPARDTAHRRNRAQARICQVKEWLQQASSRATRESNSAPNRGERLALQSRQSPIGNGAASGSITSNFSRDQYLRTIERVIDYIRAGDVYQVNLAQRLVAPLDERPIELYLRLRELNPAPFAGYFDLGDLVIASSSPERFLRVEQGMVEARPIKGTRPRWPAPEADMYSGGELRESAKDRAENVMIVDLLRNDLGRVCEFGSVQVTDPLRLESYQFVHHLVSEVRGRLRVDCGPIDLLRAAFPGGSVTGAPKIRAMQIIAELEPSARGPYCGCLGYVGFDGSMDTNILIRTFSCSRGWTQFPVGGGIVAESVPEREYEETLHKAEGLIRSLDSPLG